MRRALEMQEELSPFNAESRAEGLPHLRMGVGVHVGEVVVGNIGSETRAKYGIVGSAVNVTDRVQESARGGRRGRLGIGAPLPGGRRCGWMPPSRRSSRDSRRR